MRPSRAFGPGGPAVAIPIGHSWKDCVRSDTPMGTHPLLQAPPLTIGRDNFRSRFHRGTAERFPR